MTRPQKIYPRTSRKAVISYLAIPMAALTLTLLTGCASLSTRLPDVNFKDIEAEQIRQEVAVFQDLTRYTARLHKVAAPILLENTELCKKTGPFIGVKTHTLKSYSKPLRQAAKRELGASHIPKIIFVETGSPAEQAGLKRGDILLGPDGRPVATFNQAVLNPIAGIKQTLRYEHQGGTYETNVIPVQRCAYSVRLSSSPVINAFANGKTITVTTGMMDFTKTDSELALIIGHELAHNTMGHIRKIAGNLILSGMNTKYSRPFESEADYVGLYYLARAGYDMDNVEQVWRRLARVNPKSVARAKTHPTYSDRFLRLAAARKEIITKRNAGTPLIPNFIKPEPKN